MVKQEIYKINDFFPTPAGWRKLFIATRLPGLHQSEKGMDRNYAIQLEHMAICGKQ